MLTTGAPTNWAGNITFRATRLHRPESVGELRRIVGSARCVRALGTGHSFNRVADTGGDLVRLDGLPNRFRIDSANRTVTVGAGMRYAEFAGQLHAAGFALGSLASLPHISVAGAVATGTHGSGDSRPSLSAAVAGLEVVGPEGDLFELSRESAPERLRGSVVALGALGIVTAVTLDIGPTFDVAQWVHTGLSLDRLAERHEEIFAAAYSVSVFTDWRGDDSMVWLKHRTDDAGGAGLGSERWQGARLADRPHHPVPGMPTANCTEQSGVPGPWHERLPHFRPGFTPSRGAELQSELLLPRAAAPAAFAALRGLGERMAPVLQVSEVRTVAADELWLSPAHGRDSVAFHFTWLPDTPAVLPVIAAIQEALLPLGARPHWGKLTAAAPVDVAGLYERAGDFRALLADLDPEGKFRNPYVESHFPAGT
ncbi:MAG TPA: FAD-binding protein [Streptomyces sp.]|nr:FAD-binding protein [Streptomyces sp.]